LWRRRDNLSWLHHQGRADPADSTRLTLAGGPHAKRAPARGAARAPWLTRYGFNYDAPASICRSASAEQRLRELVAELERPFPSAAACLADDLPALCVHLKYFPRLRKRFRSSNLLERSLEEVRRRTKVIGRFPGETSCLSLCWAVLDLFLACARGLGFSDLEYRQVIQMKVARQHTDDIARIA
jgi:hypothetical protein